ncbi:MAG TPA: hypothetical protein VFI45_15675 [Candidatus Acidoferrum sp.]|nr:hypothetical protein [Candidatus Acidoferrum sp.]
MNQPNSESASETYEKERLKTLETRIEQLGEKATQLLLFLSFALVVAAILETQGCKLGPCQTAFVTTAMRFWVGAIFTILLGILPVKEIREDCAGWYNFVRWAKFGLLWASIFSVFIGAIFFLFGIWRLGLGKW